MPTAAKAVTGDYLSCWRNGTGVLGGILPGDWQSDDSDLETAWSTLALDYTVGNTVTPDPDLETSVKLASSDRWPAHPLSGTTFQPNGTNGLYVWVDNPDPSAGTGNALNLAKITAYNLARFTRHGVASGDPDLQVGDYGHVLIVNYDEGDVIHTLPSWGSDFRVWTLQLRSCVVDHRVSTLFDP